MYFRDLGDALEWRAKGETLRVEPWGPDAVRVRATPGGPLLDDLPGALLDAPPPGALLGPDLLVAPVTEAGARARAVHLPAGARWTGAWTGEEHPGGQTITVAAPLERIPLLLRDDAHLEV
ncbi:hypothetical protein [Nonomuraea sp. NPDC049400]|uniref:hypothetical protein n=1 Tax=Nonomuraea sp. NPDC049400 TaxID=3364352 RepID=UPI003790A9B5